MKINKITKISRGQDGAIWGRYLFRFQVDGSCHVYDLDDISLVEPCCYQRALCVFDLDKTDRIVPHSNSVFFGEFYQPGDEFPLLYTNVYNNCSCQPNQRRGTCCVYRIRRQGDRFFTTLVQVISISFTQDEGLWCSSGGKDTRPYGNFTYDRVNKRLYAFTMIDGLKVVRFFGFDLPAPHEGVLDENLGVPVFTLMQADIRDRFDCCYQNYIQGACCHKGTIYSLEGLAEYPREHRLARICTKQKREISNKSFFELGLTVEPELIDFKGDTCYYADNYGDLYTLEF